MSLKENIESKAKEIQDTAFTIKDISFVPSIETKHPGLTFGCSGVKLPVTVLYIDMRGSTHVLNIHNRNVVAKIHMTYYHAIVKIASSMGGEIRSFNGDSLLVFFYGNDVDTVRKAVRAAFKMRYAITDIVNVNLSRYTDIDFGIGVDCGDVVATKVGIGGSNDNKDLIWIGNAVNKSTKISDLCNSPYNVGISNTVYSKLNEDLLTYTQSNQTFLGVQNIKVNVWAKKIMKYDSEYEDIFVSSCIIKID